MEDAINYKKTFTKERPKSALHDKFARPSTGKHSVYINRNQNNAANAGSVLGF